MGRILLIVAGILVAIVAIFLVVVALQPNEFHVTRSVTIAAPPAALHQQVNDFHKWPTWSPWEKLDPAMKRTHSGAESGVGAAYAWAGNDKVGEGRMTITETKPGELVRIKLEFLAPYAATNSTEFTFKPEGEKTVVTWSMSGERDFVSKALFLDMDQLVGGDFEKGLANLKAAAEAPPAP